MKTIVILFPGMIECNIDVLIMYNCQWKMSGAFQIMNVLLL